MNRVDWINRHSPTDVRLVGESGERIQERNWVSALTTAKKIKELGLREKIIRVWVHKTLNMNIDVGRVCELINSQLKGASQETAYIEVVNYLSKHPRLAKEVEGRLYSKQEDSSEYWAELRKFRCMK